MKSYVISVSLYTGCYRHIQISASATLYKLHKAILDAFEFDDDHMHAFFMDNRIWGPNHAYYSSKTEPGDRLTKRYKLEQFNLQKGDKFRYVFDFGDSWEFQCKVLRETEEETKDPRVIRCVGESPEQYPDPDEEWDEDEVEDIWDEEEADQQEAEEACPWISEEKANELLNMIPLKKAVINTLKDYFRAGARLYGVISLGKLREIYNSQNSPMEETLFLLVTKIFSMQRDLFFVVGQDGAEPDPWQAEVVHEALLYDIEDYQEMRRLQKGKEFCILPKEAFLRYADELYYPVTPANTKLKQYLESRLPPEEAEESWMAIQDMISMDCTLQIVLESLKEHTSFFEKNFDMMEFAALYQQLSNSTRMMANRGYTPNEMAVKFPKTKRQLQALPIDGQYSLFSQETEPRPKLTLVGSPSRNAPCPCGSGRKYKNCCGKGK